MTDLTSLPGQSLAGLVSADEAALKECADWLSSLQASMRWLAASLEKCMRAEALKTHKQASLLEELRDAARKLSALLIEGEERVGIVTAPLAQRLREEMYALQDPLMVIFVETPQGFASWQKIRDQHLDALLAGLEGLKSERRHIATLTSTALEVHRRQQLPHANLAGDEEAEFRWTMPMLEGYVFRVLREVEYPTERDAVTRIAEMSRKPEPARSTLRKTYAWQNRPQKTPKPGTTNEAQSGVSAAQNADAEISHEEVMDAVLDIEQKLVRKLKDDEREAVAWTLQEAGTDEKTRNQAIDQLILGFRSSAK